MESAVDHSSTVLLEGECDEIGEHRLMQANAPASDAPDSFRVARHPIGTRSSTPMRHRTACARRGENEIFFLI